MSQEQQQQQTTLDLNELDGSQLPRTHESAQNSLNPQFSNVPGAAVPLGFQPNYQKCHNCKKCKHNKCPNKQESEPDKGLSPEELQSMLSKGQLSIVQIRNIWDASKLGSLQYIQQALSENPSINVKNIIISFEKCNSFF